MASWSGACLIALVIYLNDIRAFAISHGGYWRFLAEPWKLITFALAASGTILVAPYTGDPTWDYVDAFFMCVLAFATAPWAVGVLYLVSRRDLPLKQDYVAACLWMFSASWSYDLYILLRDGFYPPTWWPNIFLSSLLYACAGLLWNLEWRPGRGVIFAFMREGWPSPAGHSRFTKIVWIALPFMLIAAMAILYFVLPGPFH